MRNWAYKIYLQYFLPICKEKLKYGSFWFALFGGIFTLVEVENSIFKSEFLLNLFRNYFLLFIVGITLVTIVLLRENAEYSQHLGKKDCSLSLELCDLLKVKNSAIVIPTNTTFDTIMDGDFISPCSIQGKFQLKYYKSNLSKLDTLLQISLDEFYPNEYQELKDRTNTKKRRYEIGTVAKVTLKNTHYYFLAVADISSKGKTENVTMQSMTKALIGLWNFLSKFGHTELISVPVIGTGRAGLKDGNYEDVVQEIILSFACAQREENVAKGLKICLYPSDLKGSNTTWNRLCEHLRYQCSFSKKNSETELYSVTLGKSIE